MFVGFFPQGSGTGVGCISDDAVLRIYPSRFEALGEKGGTYKLAGKKFTQAEKVILHARCELSICRDPVAQGMQELECTLQFGAQALVLVCTQKIGSNLCVSLAQAFQDLFGGFALPFRSRFSRTYELVGDV